MWLADQRAVIRQGCDPNALIPLFLFLKTETKNKRVKVNIPGWKSTQLHKTISVSKHLILNVSQISWEKNTCMRNTCIYLYTHRSNVSYQINIQYLPGMHRYRIFCPKLLFKIQIQPITDTTTTAQDPIERWRQQAGAQLVNSLPTAVSTALCLLCEV